MSKFYLAHLNLHAGGSNTVLESFNLFQNKQIPSQSRFAGPGIVLIRNGSSSGHPHADTFHLLQQQILRVALFE